MTSSNIKYDQLIKPLRTPLIRDTLGAMTVCEWSPYDQYLNFAERLDPITSLRASVIKWSANQLLGLEQFEYMYVLNGNTDRIDKLFDGTPDTAHITGDYGYYSKRQATHSQKSTILPTIAPQFKQRPREVIVTWPGYSNGDRTQLNQVLDHEPTNVHLDCAYLGLTRTGTTLDVAKFSTVAISFSKTLAIPFTRISVLFTREVDIKLQLLNSIGYVNLGGVHIANKLLDTLSPNYWRDLCDSRYDQVCTTNALTPTNCYLFARTHVGTRVSTAPYWCAMYPREFA